MSFAEEDINPQNIGCKMKQKILGVQNNLTIAKLTMMTTANLIAIDQLARN
jgi:hypothetical protein